jgi:hypothetical protein
MQRILIAAVVTVGVVMLMWAGVATGAKGSHAKAAAKHLVAIKGHVLEKPTPDNTLRGQFTLLVDSAVKDAGSLVVRPHGGPLRIVGGQTSVSVTAVASLTGKRGTLTLQFSGLSIEVDDTYGIEYGTWKLGSRSGAYAGWKGGGRWANSSAPGSDHVEWFGVITMP